MDKSTEIPPADHGAVRDGGKAALHDQPQGGFPTMVELLQHRGKQQPDARAFTFLKDGETEADTLSFGALDAQARRGAAGLRAQGAAEQRVLLLYPQSLDFITAFFATLYAGAVAVPAPHAQPNRAALARLKAIIDDARPALVLTTAALLAETTAIVAQLGAEIPVTTLAALWPETRDAPPQPSPAPESLALLQYTSGSTAEPRGVMISHANIMHNQVMIRHHFDHSARTVFVGWLPMFHDMGLIGNVLQPVYVGCPCVLMSPTAFLQEPARWLRAISLYRGTTSGAPNFAYDFCVDRIPEAERTGLDLASWDIAYNGSEPVRARTIRRFAAAFAPQGFRPQAFYPCYGMAEATLLISGGTKARAPKLHDMADDTASQTLVSCGKTGRDHHLLIVDPTSLLPVPDGQTGEIWFTGGSVATGYWNRPEESAHSFGARPANHTQGHYLRTGDLGMIVDHELFVTGRIKDVIIIRGRNHYPQDIEATAQAAHPALRPDCGAAFQIDLADRPGLVIVNEVAARFFRAPPLAEIADAVRAAVAKGHGLYVNAVVLIKPGTLPKTTSGKVQRRRCKSNFLASQLEIVAEDRHGALS